MTRVARIRSAEPRDVSGWLALAKEVEHLFGRKSEVPELRAAPDGAIASLDPARPVRVQTFAPASTGGAAARRLYASFGFEDREDAEPTPAGVPTVIMVRRAPAGPRPAAGARGGASSWS